MSGNIPSKRVAFVINALSGSELKAGKSDSARIFQVLVDPALGASDPASARLVPDCPDRDTFNRELLKVLDEWNSGDQLLLYFSGHGEESKGLYHLCFGAEKKSRFPFRNVLTELFSAGVSRAILILDSCQSGAALRKGEKSSPQPLVISADEIPKGLAIIASCRANENSHEKDDQTQSVFTELFCNAITSGLSGSPTPDGKISIADLVGWVNKTLKSDPKLAGFSQTSTYGIDGAEHSVWIAQNKSGRTALPATERQPKNDEDYGSARPQKDFDNWRTNVSTFSAEVLRSYREKLRPDVRESMLPDSLDDLSFLAKANLLSDGRLYATAVLLFSEQPQNLIPTAYVQCFEFAGVDLSAP